MKSRFVFLCAALALSWTSASSQWLTIPDLEYARVHCFLAVGDSTVFVGGEMGLLMRSTDDGSSWTSLAGTGILADTILSLGQGGGYLYAGTLGVEGVYRSSDNGNSWSAAHAGLPYLSQVFGFLYKDTVLYAATFMGVFSSTDSATNWKPDTAGFGFKGYPYPDLYGGTVGITSVGRRLYTIKPWGGVYTGPMDSLVWNYIGLDTVWGYALAAIDTNVFAATHKGVYVYSGSGTTWLRRSTGLPDYLYDCILATADSLLLAYTGEWNSPIYVSSDLGVTWTAVRDTLSSGSSLHGLVTTKRYLLACADFGAWRHPIDGLLTSVNDHTQVVPAGFGLSQNFPNPFNPSTHFRYSIPESRMVRLAVFDLLGREVKVVVNEPKQAGTYDLEWNAGTLPSGVYFYRLQAGSFAETRKLVLLK